MNSKDSAQMRLPPTKGFLLPKTPFCESMGIGSSKKAQQCLPQALLLEPDPGIHVNNPDVVACIPNICFTTVTWEADRRISRTLPSVVYEEPDVSRA